MSPIHTIARVTMIGYALSLFAGCAAPRGFGIALHRSTRFEVEARLYESLPTPKSLAIAGDPHATFVLGYACEAADEPTARAAALQDCNERRRARRIESPCRTIAVGDEWDRNAIQGVPDPPRVP